MPQPLPETATAPEPWVRSICPTCGRFSDRHRFTEDHGVRTVFHLCHQGHGWSVKWMPEAS